LPIFLTGSHLKVDFVWTGRRGTIWLYLRRTLVLFFFVQQLSATTTIPYFTPFFTPVSSFNTGTFTFNPLQRKAAFAISKPLPARNVI
jgi:hypothetical protein